MQTAWSNLHRTLQHTHILKYLLLLKVGKNSAMKLCLKVVIMHDMNNMMDIVNNLGFFSKIIFFRFIANLHSLFVQISLRKFKFVSLPEIGHFFYKLLGYCTICDDSHNKSRYTRLLQREGPFFDDKSWQT